MGPGIRVVSMRDGRMAASFFSHGYVGPGVGVEPGGSEDNGVSFQFGGEQLPVLQGDHVDVLSRVGRVFRLNLVFVYSA